MQRWWGIRHLRWLWYCWQLERWYARWAEWGYVVRPQSDEDHLAAIWRGEV